MKLWIARDKDSNELYLYKHKPLLNEEQYQSDLNKDGWVCLEVPSSWFSEVAFENSPQEIELKLCHQPETIKISDCNPKAQPCVLTNHGIDTNVVKFD